MKTNIKIAMLAVLLATASNLPAPPPGQGTTCPQIVGSWTCSVTQPHAGVWQFSVATPTGGFGKTKVYRNGQFYGETPYQTFWFPSTMHGTFTLDSYSSVGNCMRSFGPFTL